MTFNKTSIILLFIIVISLNCLSCKNRIHEGMIILTVTSSEKGAGYQYDNETWKYQLQSGIIAIDPGKPGSKPQPLTKDFYSALSPEISFDAKHMLFAGQQKQGDPWQIWEMDLSGMKSRRVTSLEGNCIDPVYLPGDYLVFSRNIPEDTLKSEYALFSCKRDGSDLKRVTFSPNAYVSSTILNDGRIMAITKQAFSPGGKRMYSVMRPNGTKADMFYTADEKNLLIGPALETTDGKLVFIESETGNSQTALISITYNRPLHSRTNLSSSVNGDFLSAFPLGTGKILVSYRRSATDNYSLFEFDPESKSPGTSLYSSPGYDVLEASLVEKHPRPKKLPSEVDMHVKTGLILCQDVNCPDPSVTRNVKLQKKAVKIEVLGINSSLGIVNVEQDGSFQLKPLADTPFRIQTLDEDNNVINGPCDWLWLRPNERRGCVGCHENPEQAPQNMISLAVKKKPVIIPVHVEKIKEKSVDLE